MQNAPKGRESGVDEEAAAGPMAFDEMRGVGKARRCREPYSDVSVWLEEQQVEDLRKKCTQAEALFRRTGITFAVYGNADAAERLIPFDIIPRILSASEWRRLSAGMGMRFG